MEHPLVIALAGRAGAGKDTAADHLVAAHGFTRRAFADAIRGMLSALLEIAGVCDGWMTDRDLKEKPITGIGVSYRHLAQTLGTEWGRSVSPTLWLDIVAKSVEGCERVVITDCRFPNEADWVRSVGGQVWRIDRPDVAAVRGHVSELHDLSPDAVIPNTGSITDMNELLDALMWSLTLPAAAQ